MKSKFNRAIYIFILPILYITSGCSTLKPPATPDKMWVPPVQDKIPSKKISVSPAMGKEMTSALTTLTLAQCVDIALTNSPSTQEAWIDAKRAEAELKQSQSEWYPKVKGYLNTNLQKQDLNYKTGKIVNDYSYYGPALSVTYLLFDFGGMDSRVREAVETLRMSNFLFNQAIQDLILEVEVAYYSLYTAQKEVQTGKENVRDAQKIRYITKRKYETGLIPSVDIHKTRARYEEELYDLSHAEGSEKTSKADLAKVIGLPADMEFEITMPSDDVMIDMAKEEVAKLIEEGLANRSDISALKANVIAKEAAVKAADSSLWPSISAEVSASRNDYNYYHSATTELNDDNKFTGFVGLTWDIFDGFYNRNVKRAAERDLEIAKQQLIKTELKTSADIWSAYYDFKASGSKRKHSRAFLNEAQTTFGLVVKGYETGLEDILDLLTAQRDLSDARSKKIRAEIDWFVSLAKLIHSAGGLSTQKDIDKKVLGAR